MAQSRLKLAGRSSSVSLYLSIGADIDYETLRTMKEAGCRLLCIGVESGNQQILDGINKRLKLSQVREFMKNARKPKILVHACFMVGNPGETKQTMNETLDFAKKLKPDTAQFFPLMVYPGTEAFDWAKKHGYLTTTNYAQWLTENGLHNCIRLYSCGFRSGTGCLLRSSQKVILFKTCLYPVEDLTGYSASF